MRSTTLASIPAILGVLFVAFVIVANAGAECAPDTAECRAAAGGAMPSTFTQVAGMVAADGTYVATPTPTLTSTPAHTPTPTPTPTPTAPVIYLTFDDGPNTTWTPRVMDVLARYDAHATFFAVGAYVDAYPAIVADALARGHSIGLHGYGHASFTRMSWTAISDDLARSQSAVLRATQQRSTCVRPPYGAVNATVRDVIASRAMTLWLWNVDPRDWSRPGVQAIVANVRRYAYPGAVVLFHDGGGDRSQTVAALEILLPELAARGYRFAALPCMGG